jgi:hypothetical protein
MNADIEAAGFEQRAGRPRDERDTEHLHRLFDDDLREERRWSITR